MRPLLSLDEAIARVLAHVEPLPPEDVPVREAFGRVLAEDARAVVDLPPFPSSAMDGFAVRAGDTPGRLPVVARVAAGRPAERPLGAGEAMAIATGGVVPEGADAVIPVEYVVEHDNEVEIPEAAKGGANVRPRGGDVGAGSVLVPAGTRLAAAQLGALAAAGLERVRCGRRPRVAVLTTGTELRRPGERLGPGDVWAARAADAGHAGRGERPDVRRGQAHAASHDHVARTNIAAARAHVRARLGYLPNVDAVVMGDNILDGDDGIRAVGNGAAGRDRNRLAGAERRIRRAPGRCMRDDGARAGAVGCAHRVAVHRRARERRQVDHRAGVLGEHAPERLRQRDALRRQLPRPLEHEPLGLVDGE